MPKPWRVLQTRISFEDPYIRLRTDRCETGSGHVIEGYHVVEYPDWLNTVAITRGLDIVLVKEYRHGATSVITGLPSGTVHAGEEPIAAAARELREETGYTSGEFVDLGWAYANPATQNNRSWSFLALNVDLTSPQEPDQSEDIDVELKPVADFIDGPGPEEPHGLHLATIHLAVKFLLSSRDEKLADLRRVVRAATSREVRQRET
jgi:ADP-ribose pyrophosphatase